MFTVLVPPASPQEVPAQAPPQTDVDKTPTIKVDVKLVNVFVTVTD